MAVPRHFLMIVLVLLGLVALGQNLWYWNQLPERVATHFGVNGQPDSWMDRTSATLLMLSVQIGLPWFLVGIGRMICGLPSSMINIPNRNYWLESGRREMTLAYVQQFLLMVGVVASLFMMSVNHLTYVANMRSEALNLQAMVLLLVLFLCGIGLMIASMWRRLRIPQQAASE